MFSCGRREDTFFNTSLNTFKCSVYDLRCLKIGYLFLSLLVEVEKGIKDLFCYHNCKIDFMVVHTGLLQSIVFLILS